LTVSVDRDNEITEISASSGQDIEEQDRMPNKTPNKHFSNSEVL